MAMTALRMLICIQMNRNEQKTDCKVEMMAKMAMIVRLSKEQCVQMNRDKQTSTCDIKMVPKMVMLVSLRMSIYV